MSLHYSDQNGELSPAARATLDEYALAERNRILREATRLSSGDLITAADVVNAHDALRARSDAARPLSSRLSSDAVRYRQATVLTLAVFTAILMLVGALLIVLLVWTRQPAASADQSANPIWLAIGASFAGLAAMASTLLIVSSERRRRLASDSLREEIHRVYGEPRDADEIWLSERGVLDNGSELFLRHWERLDNKLRRLALVALRMPEAMVEDYPIGPLLDRLTDLQILDSEIGSQIRDLLYVRNDVAHNRAIPKTEINKVVDSMRRLDEHLSRLTELHEIS